MAPVKSKVNANKRKAQSFPPLEMVVVKKPAPAPQKEVSNNMSPMPGVPGAAAAATKSAESSIESSTEESTPTKEASASLAAAPGTPGMGNTLLLTSF